MIEYPSSLPRPQVNVVTKAERRALDNKDRPREARALQRDRSEFERLTFVLSETKAEVFDTWWREDLLRGGAWFATKWPLPRGFVTAVRKFIETPRWEYVSSGYWRVSAVCEVRGASEMPFMRSLDRNEFLDLFDGAEASIVGHQPNIGPLNFVWNGTDIALSGDGAAVVDTETGSGFAQGEEWTPPYVITFPMRIEIDATIGAEAEDSEDMGAFVEMSDELTLLIRVYNLDAPTGGGVQVFIDGGDIVDITGLLSLAGLIRVVVDVTETSLAVTVNDVLLATVLDDFTQCALISALNFTLTEDNANARLERLRIYTP